MTCENSTSPIQPKQPTSNYNLIDPSYHIRILSTLHYLSSQSSLVMVMAQLLKPDFFIVHPRFKKGEMKFFSSNITRVRKSLLLGIFPLLSERQSLRCNFLKDSTISYCSNNLTSRFLQRAPKQHRHSYMLQSGCMYKKQSYKQKRSRNLHDPCHKRPVSSHCQEEEPK